MSEKELFLGYIKAYSAKDVRGMISFFDDECVFENISARQVTVRAQGKAELEALARKSADAFSTIERKGLTLTGGPTCLVAEIGTQGPPAGGSHPRPESGQHLALRGVSVFQFSGGKISASVTTLE